MIRSTSAIIVLFLYLSLALPALAAPPRYSLQPGQHLIYTGSEHTLAGSNFGVNRTTELRVVRTNADGSATVVITHHHERTDGRQSPPRIISQRDDLFVIEVFPDGRIPKRSLDTMGVMSLVLPQLPPDDAAAGASWSFNASDITYACRPLTEDVMSFELVPDSGRDDLNGFSSTSTYLMDLDAGVVQSVDTAFFHKERQTRKGTDRLTVVQPMPADELAKLAADVDVFVSTRHDYDRAMAIANGSAAGAEAQRQLDVAMVHLQAARARVTSDLLAAQVETMIRTHNQQLPQRLDRIEYMSSIIGQPGADWTHDDLDGVAHTLADYRGRVIVLDFWYKACGWCIRAMPQLTTVADHFKGRPVAVLGMNIDRRVEDAENVVNRMQLNYTTLRSNKDTARLYGVAAFPTLVVVDAKGVVRMVHTGYSGTLDAELIDFIDTLLGETE